MTVEVMPLFLPDKISPNLIKGTSKCFTNIYGCSILSAKPSAFSTFTDRYRTFIALTRFVAHLPHVLQLDKHISLIDDMKKAWEYRMLYLMAVVAADAITHLLPAASILELPWEAPPEITCSTQKQDH